MKILTRLFAYLSIWIGLCLSAVAQADGSPADFSMVSVVESEKAKGSYFLYYYSKTELSEVRLLKSSTISYPLVEKRSDLKDYNVYMPSAFIRLRKGMDLYFVSQAQGSQEMFLHKYRTNDKLKAVLIEVAQVDGGSFDAGLPAQWVPQDELDVGSEVSVDDQKKAPISQKLSGGKSIVKVIYQAKDIHKEAGSEAWAEFNEWRRLCGLPQIKESPEMTAFAQNKANYRAFYRLKNNHAGPKAPDGWREGCAEAFPFWGWLSCRQEEDALEGGAGLAVGLDGERYMVLVLRGGSGRCLLATGRDNTPVHDTSYMSKRPWRIPRGAKSYNEASR